MEAHRHSLGARLSFLAFGVGGLCAARIALNRGIPSYRSKAITASERSSLRNLGKHKRLYTKMTAQAAGANPAANSPPVHQVKMVAGIVLERWQGKFLERLGLQGPDALANHAGTKEAVLALICRAQSFQFWTRKMLLMPRNMIRLEQQCLVELQRQIRLSASVGPGK